MALILLDGCEDYSSFAGGAGRANTAGRNQNGFEITSGTARFSLPAAQESDTLTFGVAMYLSSAITGGGNPILFRSDAAATIHTTVQFLATGAVAILRGTATQIAISAAGAIPIGAWFYFELQAKLHDTTGFVTARINGTVVCSATNVDTKNAGTKTTYDTVDLTNPAIGPSTMRYDDIYVMSGAGDSFLGDITVDTLYPNGNGNASQWVGSDGDSIDNYLLVDEVPPVTADYTKSSTVGQLDQYALTDLIRGGGTIVGVVHTAHMALASAGSQTFQIVNRRTADNVSPTLTSASTTYAGYHHALTTDPETSAAWTIVNVNALQTGVKVV